MPVKYDHLGGHTVAILCPRSAEAAARWCDVALALRDMWRMTSDLRLRSRGGGVRSAPPLLAAGHRYLHQASSIFIERIRHGALVAVRGVLSSGDSRPP